MKPQYQHELMTSFMLWFDHELLQKGEAYSNQTGVLYYDNDTRLPSSYKAYSSCYKQWVNDSSITGETNPIIPTEFNGSNRGATDSDQYVTGFTVSDVGSALDGYLSANYGTFDGVYKKENFLSNGQPVYSHTTDSNKKINKNTDKWAFRDTVANRIAWEESSSTSSDFPWNATSWTRKNNYGATSSTPSFSNLLSSIVVGDIIIDFENGRVIETAGNFGTNETITGSFAVKDFNIYLTNETEEDLIIENKFKLNSRYGTPTMSGIEPYDQVTPAIFINHEYMRNDGFAFGGEDKSTSTIKAVVLADNEYQLEGVLSIFADSARKAIQKIPFTGHPSTEYGDIKNGVYNYTGLAQSYSSPNPFFIEDVAVSKLSAQSQQKIPGDLEIGFIDFEVSTTRFPRQ